MGMDVCGKGNPDAYFRRNNSGWSYTNMYLREIAPEICAKCEHWGTNDGDGLEEVDCLALANILDEHIASGHCATWGAEVDARYGPWFVSNMRDFREFLLVCKGFEIW